MCSRIAVRALLARWHCINVCRAIRCISVAGSMPSRAVSVCLSCSCVLSQRVIITSSFFRCLLNKPCFYRNSVQYQKSLQVIEEQSFDLDTGPQLFSHSFIALWITRCSKSAQKFTVRVRQVNVAMATTHLVLNQFKNYLSHQLRSLEIIGKCCEMVKLCHIICSGPFFLRHSVHILQQ